MKKLDNVRLEDVKGGVISAVWIPLIVASVTIFISGIIEGFTNPTKCEVE